MICFFLSLILVILIPVPANAYFDPGTGALLVQGLVGLFAACCLFYKRIINRIKTLLFSSKDDPSSEMRDK